MRSGYRQSPGSDSEENSEVEELSPGLSEHDRHFKQPTTKPSRAVKSSSSVQSAPKTSTHDKCKHEHSKQAHPRHCTVLLYSKDKTFQKPSESLSGNQCLRSSSPRTVSVAGGSLKHSKSTTVIKIDGKAESMSACSSKNLLPKSTAGTYYNITPAKHSHHRAVSTKQLHQRSSEEKVCQKSSATGSCQSPRRQWSNFFGDSAHANKGLPVPLKTYFSLPGSLREEVGNVSPTKSSASSPSATRKGFCQVPEHGFKAVFAPGGSRIRPGEIFNDGLPWDGGTGGSPGRIDQGSNPKAASRIVGDVEECLRSSTRPVPFLAELRQRLGEAQLEAAQSLDLQVDTAENQRGMTGAGCYNSSTSEPKGWGAGTGSCEEGEHLQSRMNVILKQKSESSEESSEQNSGEESSKSTSDQGGSATGEGNLKQSLKKLPVLFPAYLLPRQDRSSQRRHTIMSDGQALPFWAELRQRSNQVTVASANVIRHSIIGSPERPLVANAQATATDKLQIRNATTGELSSDNCNHTELQDDVTRDNIVSSCKACEQAAALVGSICKCCQNTITETKEAPAVLEAKGLNGEQGQGISAVKGAGKDKGSAAKGNSKGLVPPMPDSEGGKKGSAKGKAPPPPSPKGDEKGKGKGKSKKAEEPRKPEVVPRIQVKRLFWNPIRLRSNAEGKTVWDIIDEERAEIDAEALEQLFAEEARRGKGPKQEQGEGVPTRKLIRVLEETRRRIVCVMLARLPGSTPEIVAVLRQMDSSRLNRDQVELILSSCPSAEEIQLLRKAQEETVIDDLNGWDVAEEFLLSLIAVPRFQLRLQAWEFINSFQERLDEIACAAVDVSRACYFLRTSSLIRHLLGLALSAGNFLNGGTVRGRADGFAIDILAQLRTVKSSQASKQQTLIDYITQQMEQRFPGELAILFEDGREAECIARAARPKLSELAQDTYSLASKAVTMRNSIWSSTWSSEDDDEVCLLQAGEILSMSICELEELQQHVGQLHIEYNQLCFWFHMDADGSSQKASDEFFGIWKKFLKDIYESRAAAMEQERRNIQRQKMRPRVARRRKSRRSVTRAMTLPPNFINPQDIQEVVDECLLGCSDNPPDASATEVANHTTKEVAKDEV